MMAERLSKREREWLAAMPVWSDANGMQIAEKFDRLAEAYAELCSQARENPAVTMPPSVGADGGALSAEDAEYHANVLRREAHHATEDGADGYAEALLAGAYALDNPRVEPWRRTRRYSNCMFPACADGHGTGRFCEGCGA